MRPRCTRIAISFLLLAAGVVLSQSLPAQPATRPIALAALEGSVNPGSADYLVRAIEAAQRDGAQAIVIRLDTPGGMVESTREIVKAELVAGIPVVVWVGPDGARAGSAGVFITLAAHVAAMAPATNIGAAHPVSVGPGGAQETDETMSEKVTNDLAAWAQSIARQRGRNADWAEKAVRESVSVPSDKAVELGVVELIAPDLPGLLRQLDGRTVQTAAGPTQLATLGAPIREIPRTPRERFLEALGDPNIAFLLIGLGVLGLLGELYNPGTLWPGVFGGLCLAFGLLATRMLPVRAGAVVLLILGGALVAAEFFVTSWGLLAVAGVACFVIGAFLLTDPSDPGFLVDRDFGVSWGSVAPVLLTVTAVLGTIVWKVAQARARPQITGAFGMIGEIATVEDPVGPTRGRVFVRGELWEARAETELAPGARVRVSAIDGLVLTVVPVEGAVEPR